MRRLRLGNLAPLFSGFIAALCLSMLWITVPVKGLCGPTPPPPPTASPSASPDCSVDPCGAQPTPEPGHEGECISGGVVCCNGETNACDWADQCFHPNVEPGDPVFYAILDCILAHERNHMQYPNLQCPPSGYGPAGVVGDWDKKETECRASTEELVVCLNSIRCSSLCEGSSNPDCLGNCIVAIITEQEEVRKKIAKYCKDGHPAASPTQIPTPSPSPTATDTPVPPTPK